MLRIANAAGFLGDRIEAAKQLVEKVEVDCLTLAYLDGFAMPALARQREKDSERGYAGDFLESLRLVCPAIYLQPQLKIVTSAGGMNPRACVEAASAVLVENGSPNLAVAMVRGDDLLDRLEELLAAGCALENIDTGQPFRELTKPVIAANALLGAQPIADALREGARLVINGRVAAASLTVGPSVEAFGWAWDEWDRLAGATVAGHLIASGAQVSGGSSTSWRDFDLVQIGYPIAELAEDGKATITKPPRTGGAVTRQNVVEQLVYEMGDPAHLKTPDVDVDLTSVAVHESGADRVSVAGATGCAAPQHYEVSLAYRAGFTATAEVVVWGRDCREKARAAAEMVFSRTEASGHVLDVKHVEFLGTGDAVPLPLADRPQSEPLRRPGVPPRSDRSGLPSDTEELVLRMTVQSGYREAALRFTREIAPLVASGPAGLAESLSGRPRVHPLFASWPTLVPRDAIEPILEVRPANEWE